MQITLLTCHSSKRWTTTNANANVEESEEEQEDEEVEESGAVDLAGIGLSYIHNYVFCFI